jgi:hypothetical protein
LLLNLPQSAAQRIQSDGRLSQQPAVFCVIHGKELAFDWRTGPVNVGQRGRHAQNRLPRSDLGLVRIPSEKRSTAGNRQKANCPGDTLGDLGFHVQIHHGLKLPSA